MTATLLYTEAATLPTTPHQPVNISDYREELVVMLSSAWKFAAKANQEAQRRYKHQYGKSTTPPKYQIGVFLLWGNQQITQPWHGLYQIISRDDPGPTVAKVYFPDHPPMQVHQLRIKNCPISLPCGYYFYGKKQSRPGWPPKWIKKLLDGPPVESKGGQDQVETGLRLSTALGEMCNNQPEGQTWSPD